MSSFALSTLLDDLELGTPPAKRTMDAAVTDLLHAIGEDPAREGLLKTPERVANPLAFLTSGGDKIMADVLNGAVFTEDYDQMVLVKDIEFYSLCEHHILPFFGKAHIAYLPAGRVVGLSKLPRLLEVYARRLQVQERSTQQVAWAIQEALRPRVSFSHFLLARKRKEQISPFRTSRSLTRQDHPKNPE